MAFLPLYQIILGITIVAAIYVYLLPKKNSTALPPGPKPLPLVGNIADLPPAGGKEWEHWLKHKDLYGPISSVTVLGTTIIILSDAKLAFELMEKRGHIHSDRPHMVFSMEMCGWGDLLAMTHYNDRFRTTRKQIYQVMGTKAAMSKYLPLQDVEVHRFLLRTMQKPEELISHIRTEAGAIILKVGYGYNVEPHKPDPLVDIADKALAQFSAATVPGAWMVDTMPMLKYVPAWFPGAGFKKLAKEWNGTLQALAEKPMRFVKQEMAAKRNEPSFVSDAYNKAERGMSDEDEDVLKYAAAALYTGGADTTVSTMSTFFMAMTINPEVQRKAREEIDRVIGTHRLPEFSDRDNLPYVEAVVKEAFRWHPIGPMGLPHVAVQDDICEGYLIPKGAMIIPNIWWFCHDPESYPDPMAFNPDRYLANPPPPDPKNYIFGFGRRICPGRLLAESSVWLTVAKTLAALDISKGVDEKGAEVEPTVDFLPGIISHPVPFTATIKARSPKHEELIRAVESDHPWEESSAKALESIKM